MQFIWHHVVKWAFRRKNDINSVFVCVCAADRENPVFFSASLPKKKHRFDKFAFKIRDHVCVNCFGNSDKRTNVQRSECVFFTFAPPAETFFPLYLSVEWMLIIIWVEVCFWPFWCLNFCTNIFAIWLLPNQIYMNQKGNTTRTHKIKIKADGNGKKFIAVLSLNQHKPKCFVHAAVEPHTTHITTNISFVCCCSCVVSPEKTKSFETRWD